MMELIQLCLCFLLNLDVSVIFQNDAMQQHTGPILSLIQPDQVQKQQIYNLGICGVALFVKVVQNVAQD